GDMHAFYPKDFVSYQFELFHSKQLSLRERLLSFVTKSTAVHRVDLVRRLLAPDPNLNVLDLGCGRASFLYYLREELKCRDTCMVSHQRPLPCCWQRPDFKWRRLPFLTLLEGGWGQRRVYCSGVRYIRT